MKKTYITKPYLPPLDEYVVYLQEIWNSRELTNNGSFHKKFEFELANYLGVKHVSLVNNATSGLMIAMEAMKLTGEVITTPFSFIATSHSIKWNRLKPIFVDTDNYIGNLTANAVEKKISNKTSGILAAHNFGFPGELNKMENLSKKYNLPLIYDAAPAIGVKINGESILKFGDISVLSFHATKIFNTFEGGAIISKTKKMKDKIDKIKNFGIIDEETVTLLGINGKMSEINAAMGLLQLKYLNKIIKARENIYKSYIKGIKQSANYDLIYIQNDLEYNYSYFPILFKTGKKIRDKADLMLKRQNIHCRKYWYPLITDHLMYKKNIHETFFNAKELSEKILSLPIYPGLEEKYINMIINTINKNLA